MRAASRTRPLSSWLTNTSDGMVQVAGELHTGVAESVQPCRSALISGQFPTVLARVPYLDHGLDSDNPPVCSSHLSMGSDTDTLGSETDMLAGVSNQSMTTGEYQGRKRSGRRSDPVHLISQHAQERSGGPDLVAGRGVAGLCYQLRQSMMPYASLIVTVALIATAGLLYWLILGPTGESTQVREMLGRDSQGNFSMQWPGRSPQPAMAQAGAVAEDASDGLVERESSTTEESSQDTTTSALTPQVEMVPVLDREKSIEAGAADRVATLTGEQNSHAAPVARQQSSTSGEYSDSRAIASYPTTQYAVFDFLLLDPNAEKRVEDSIGAQRPPVVERQALGPLRDQAR
jgi:hypothetical protein